MEVRNHCWKVPVKKRSSTKMEQIWTDMPKGLCRMVGVRKRREAGFWRCFLCFNRIQTHQLLDYSLLEFSRFDLSSSIRLYCQLFASLQPWRRWFFLSNIRRRLPWPLGRCHFADSLKQSLSFLSRARGTSAVTCWYWRGFSFSYAIVVVLHFPEVIWWAII
jgi:hypothetical protein